MQVARLHDSASLVLAGERGGSPRVGEVLDVRTERLTYRVHVGSGWRGRETGPYCFTTSANPISVEF